MNIEQIKQELKESVMTRDGEADLRARVERLEDMTWLLSRIVEDMEERLRRKI